MEDDFMFKASSSRVAVAYTSCYQLEVAAVPVRV
jgi:hypothetical protein